MKKSLTVILSILLLLLSLPISTSAAGPYQITVAAVENGEILVNGSHENNSSVTVEEGSNAAIVVRPNVGYEIDSVTVGATTYSTDEEIGSRLGNFQRDIVVNSDISVSATFRQVLHTVTTNVGPNGTLSPMNPQVDHDQDVTFTITPNPGYTIRSLSVDGHPENVNENNQFTLHNVQNDRTLSVEFVENITHTITTVVGINGTITPMNPKVGHSGDVTFTITPDAGYVIDELWVDGRPELVDESGQFTVFHVERSMNLEVSFMKTSTYTITVPKPENGNIQIMGKEGYVPANGTTLTSNTHDIESFYIFPDDGFHTPANYAGGYKLARVYMVDDTGAEMDAVIDVYYDEMEGKLRADIETQSDYTLLFEFERRMPGGVTEYYEPVVILNSETGTWEAVKSAVRREYGLRGIYLWDDDVSAHIAPIFKEQTSGNGITYKYGEVYVRHPLFSSSYLPVPVYVVDDVTNIVFRSQSKLYISKASDPISNDAVFEMQDTSNEASTWIGGVFATSLMPFSEASGSSFENLSFVTGHPMWGYYSTSSFYGGQFHVVNNAGEPENQLNLFPFTIIKENALCMSVRATSESGTQEAFTWELDTYPHVTSGDATQEVFFGNDRVILEKPRGDIGDITSMKVASSNSPGYTFKNNSDGTVTIDFLSNFYDRVTVPLTIVKKNGEAVVRNLIIHRVGVDIQAHNARDGNPSTSRTVFHGTQYGNLVDFADGNGFKITASYFIPDYSDKRPYGLYVTREYSDGRIETEIVTQPMSNPHPATTGIFDRIKKAFMYNDGSSGGANVVDYLIYAGSNLASAPIEVSVLVLKNAPTVAGTFGGVNYGSGTGVKWTKP